MQERGFDSYYRLMTIDDLIVANLSKMSLLNNPKELLHQIDQAYIIADLKLAKKIIEMHERVDQILAESKKRMLR